MSGACPVDVRFPLDIEGHVWYNVTDWEESREKARGFFLLATALRLS